MTFSEYPYQRPDMADFEAKFAALLSAFEQAASFEAQSAAFEGINALRNDLMTLRNLAYVRHSLDTRDAFYDAENSFFDQAMPAYQSLNNQFYQALMASRYKAELSERWGEHLFNLVAASLKTFAPEILEDLQEENRLSSDYTRLKGRAEIDFRGGTYNLSTITVPETDADRGTRREANAAKWAFYAGHGEEIDRLFDELVQVRTRIAHKLGFDNFVELGYWRMGRTDYDAAMVAQFRQQIERDIVPIATELYERQRQRLGLDSLHYYDEEFRFASGNPQPQGDPDWIVQKAAQMYAELSPETDEFFQTMQRDGLMSLVAAPGKATGGYCTFIENYGAPYIFSNFNGSSGDIDVLTHEAGHAFQVFSSRDIGIGEYNWPTMEACEIHSMSMEFFTRPWMPLFFGEQADKYRFMQLAAAIAFLPYGAAIDEFQHWVYAHPTATPQARKEAWRDLERRYLPHRDYAGHEFLEAGSFWQKQSHLFSVPFYYIDYALAQICAFQFWVRDQEHHDSAWADYLKLCQAGGSRPFLQLVERAGLISPFAEGCVQSTTGHIRRYLAGIDDAGF